MNEIEIKDRLQAVKKLREDIRFYKQIDVVRAYMKMMRNLRRQERRILWQKIFRQTAAVLFIPLLVATSVLVYLYSRNATNTTAESYAEVKAVPGVVLQLELPDRSRVWLNSGSSLRYPVAFGNKTRPVELNGEAFFEVHTDAVRPFEVATPTGLAVTARGTAFNVRAYDDETWSEVVLLEGEVEVASRTYRAGIAPGEMLRLDRDSRRVVRQRVRTDEKIAWKDGRLIFRSTPIEEVMKQLARRYNADITLHNPKGESCLVRATFTSETLTQILDFIKLAAPVEWRIEKTKQNADTTFDRPQIHVRIK